MRAELSLAGAVLAGGASRRMGQDKARLCTAAGVPFLAQALGLLRPRCHPLYVLGRPAEGAIGLADLRPGQGPLAALEALAAALPEGHAALVLPCDMPGLSERTLARLIDAFQRQPGRPAAACFRAGQPEPLLAIYPRAVLLRAAPLLDTGERSARALLGDAQPVLLDDLAEGERVNLNTPAELARWRG